LGRSTIQVKEDVGPSSLFCKFQLCSISSTCSWPGYLDVTASGITAFPGTSRYTAIRKGLEQASLDARKASLTGWTTYRRRDDQGWLTPGLYHHFELEIDALLEPKAHDGEAEGFELMGTQRLVEALKQDEFKPSSACAMARFLLLHKMIETDEKAVREELAKPWSLPVTR
jgi:hypothetical protein